MDKELYNIWNDLTCSCKESNCTTVNTSGFDSSFGDGGGGGVGVLNRFKSYGRKVSSHLPILSEGICCTSREEKDLLKRNYLKRSVGRDVHNDCNEKLRFRKKNRQSPPYSCCFFDSLRRNATMRKNEIGTCTTIATKIVLIPHCIQTIACVSSFLLNCLEMMIRKK